MTDLATLDEFGALTDPGTLKIQRLLPGPIERVWAYLTESDLRRQWLAAGQMEMKVGAPVELVWRNDELLFRGIVVLFLLLFGVPFVYGIGFKMHQLASSARGGVQRIQHRREEARAEFERAASLTRNARERDLLLERARAAAGP